jgi:hypothetical protein
MSMLVSGLLQVTNQTISYDNTPFSVLRHVRLLPSKPLMPLISDHHSPASYPSDPRFPSPLSPTMHSNLSRIPPCHFLEGFSLTGGCAFEVDDDDFED